MTTQSFARPLLMLVALLSVQLFAVASSQADREKTFSRSGRLIVVDKPAAELLPSYDIKSQPPAQAFPVPRPPWSSDLIFPCSQCHARMQPPNAKHRVLTEYHTEIVLHHGESPRWCTDCHNLNNRDKLRLVSGELDRFYRILPAVRSVPWRQVPRLESRRITASGPATGMATNSTCSVSTATTRMIRSSRLLNLCRHRNVQATRPTDTRPNLFYSGVRVHVRQKKVR